MGRPKNPPLSKYVCKKCDHCEKQLPGIRVFHLCEATRKPGVGRLSVELEEEK